MPTSKTKQKSLNSQKRKTVAKEGISKSRLQQLKASQKKQIKQYDMGNYCRFTAGQMKTWKPLSKQLKDHLYHLIDSDIKAVVSKPQFSGQKEVQQLLDRVKLQLKAKLHTIQVPNKKHGYHGTMKAQITELRALEEDLTRQEHQLEQAIRKEQRMIESLEGLEGLLSEAELCIKVPENQLDIPELPKT